MWSVRVVAIALLALLLVATWLVGVVLGHPDLLWGVLFGTLAGVPTFALVMWAASHAPLPEPCAQSAPQLSPRERLERDFNHTGYWTTINNLRCYIVPPTDPFTGDGELVEDWGDPDATYYVLGEFRSRQQFSVAAIENEYGVSRRPHGGFPAEWFWGEL